MFVFVVVVVDVLVPVVVVEVVVFVKVVVVVDSVVVVVVVAFLHTLSVWTSAAVGLIPTISSVFGSHCVRNDSS